MQARWECSFAPVKALLSVHTGAHFAIFCAHTALISLLTPSLALTVSRSPAAITFVLLCARVLAASSIRPGMISGAVIVNNYFISRLRLLKEIWLIPEGSLIPPSSRWVCDASVINAD